MEKKLFFVGVLKAIDEKSWMLEPDQLVKGTDPTQSTYFTVRGQSYFLSSSKILTPHPPLRPASVYPRLCCGGRTDSPGGEGDGGGGSIFWKTREIGLPSYSKICTLWDPRIRIRIKMSR